MTIIERKRKILIIEDDINLGFILKKYLELRNYIVTLSTSGSDGFKKILQNKYDLFIIDIGLPEINGLFILKEVRKSGINRPAIIITDRDETENELKSFEFGANLFHRKPINYKLLEVQISNLTNNENQVIYRFKELNIDYDLRAVIREGKLISLSYLEFNLLNTFLTTPTKIFSRDEIIRKVFDNTKDVEHGAVDTLVSRLRKKLGMYKNKEIIETIYKSGYRINSEYLDF